MTDDVITDLKQFIAATVSQQSSDLREDIVGTMRDDIVSTVREDIIGTLRTEIQKLDDKLSAKIDDLSSSVPKLWTIMAKLRNLSSTITNSASVDSKLKLLSLYSLLVVIWVLFDCLASEAIRL